MDQELSFAPAAELRQKIDAKEVSIVELTELFYQRIESLNPQLNAYLALCPEQALQDAARAQEAVQRWEAVGPLHGIPISIKDLELTRGLTSTLGSGRIPGPRPGH